MINEKTIIKDKKILSKEIIKYINIIKKEYNELAQIPNDLSNIEKIIHIEDTGTISLFVSNNEFYFPTDAYKVLNNLKNNSLYGTNKEHKTYTKKNLLNNDNTSTHILNI